MKYNKKMLDEVMVLLCYTKNLSKGMSCADYTGTDEYDYSDMAIAAFALINK